ncbi:probable carboxylesterase 2 [Cynara cardunculus var. scolymus]|uniref:Alpha/beta hydrolase fold-3 n=1 Tax=Cynara cardunculus var. scolymus TaxID=59895 RepID=A0A103XWU5_CYNCS|nr:probable carboxylesterase 2 [Cynara cardunculus var. scolymus]KVH98346.1 Alpha/beta hydrolase fold-3 [Cynara cardunculus var. scolymus]
MGSVSKEILQDVPPYLRVYNDGTIERLVGTEVVPPTADSATGVTSKDVLISPKTAVSARLYRPTLSSPTQKLPLLIYFHGGAFCIASPSFPLYHRSVNNLVSESRVIAVSVDYRLVPEHPLPAAFDDAWDALRWASSHVPGGTGTEEWLKENVDFNRVFLAGDSAGATIAHHTAIRIGTKPDPNIAFKISGIILINPYFWGKEPIGSEAKDSMKKAMVDKWWQFACPPGSSLGLDDPLINPMAKGAPDLSGMGCSRVIVTVAGKDILRDRGCLYYESLVKSKWEGKAEMMEIDGEDHVFHIFNPDGDKAVNMIKRLATFINQQ